MSISASLANAVSGLSAASRAAQLVSSNVANAMTEGYGRREIELSARVGGTGGAGVQVDGTRRVIDETLLRDRRLSDAALGAATTEADFHSDMLALIGTPDEAGSLAARITSFDTALIEAASRPDSSTRLANVLAEAKSLAGALTAATDGLQQLRQDADADIASTVGRLNDTLTQIADVNAQILRSKSTGQDSAALEDQRQRLIDSVSAIVPLRQLPRENGTVALYSLGGALLLDAEPATFGFTGTAPITPDMTLASGALSGLTINGNPVRTEGDFSPIGGGTLSALFRVRDELSVAAQDDLDAVARDLVSRFEDPTLDPTLAAGDPGLFTDGGSALDPADVVGLAGRIAVNVVVDPQAGGALWRLRDGLGAAATGPVGDGSLLTAYAARLDLPLAPSGGSFSPAARSAAGLIADLTSGFGQAVDAAGSRSAFARASQDALREAELAGGVDTDQELQKLLLIEQAYAANARVIQTADELLDILIGL